MTCQQNQQTQGYCAPHAFSSSTNRITDSGFTYDASGELTNDGAHTYQYDAEGRLVSVDNGSTASYVYNALGERVEKDVGGTYNEYAFDRDGEPEAEGNCLRIAAHAPLRRGTTNNGWVDSWVNFEGQHIAHYENGGVYYTYSNQVGTAGVVTDWTGAVIQDELHYPWGKVWTTMGTQTEERFASLHHRDSATNLDPTHFRMYSSDEGRWLTPDPAQADIYNPQSMSRYAYAGGNPFMWNDPYGLGPNWHSIWTGTVKVVGGVTIGAALVLGFPETEIGLGGGLVVASGGISSAALFGWGSGDIAAGFTSTDTDQLDTVMSGVSTLPGLAATAFSGNVTAGSKVSLGWELGTGSVGLGSAQNLAETAASGFEALNALTALADEERQYASSPANPFEGPQSGDNANGCWNTDLC